MGNHKVDRLGGSGPGVILWHKSNPKARAGATNPADRMLLIQSVAEMAVEKASDGQKDVIYKQSNFTSG
jgi:hypothetical protein